MQSIYPTLKYRDARAALDLLERAFGLQRLSVHEGENGGIAHAEMRFGDDVLMFGSASEGDERFNQGVGHASVYLVTDDPDGLHRRAVQAGAEIVRPLVDQDYGSREFSARDHEGNLWSFGTYRPSLDSN